MSRKSEIFRNVGSSWFSLGVTILVGVFISPFVLHRLGDEAFGLWVLILSLTGYYGLFDLGIRSSIIRYVAKYSATGERDELNRLISTAFLSYSIIGLVCLLITLLGTYYVDHLFHVPAGYLRTSRLLFLMVGTSVSVGFPLGVFAGILEGLQRFYLLNLVTTGYTLLRALLIVVALRRGGGLLTVALITVALPVVAAIIHALVVLRQVPVRFGLSYVSRATMRRIANYSGVTFMILVGGRLRLKTDAMVIGTFLTSAAITYFTIGSRLVDYAGDVVSSLAQIFIPMSSQTHATGDVEGLRRILIAGNRACALVMFPIAALLVVLGRSVIEAWVGAKYIASSYPVMLVLLVPSTIMLAQSAAGRVLFGMARHRTWAIVTLIEGIANLILSIVLVRKWGIMGDALGTAIPMLCSMLLFMPQHVCGLLGLRLRTYFREGFLLPLLLTAPMVGVLLLEKRWFTPHNYLQLAMQASLALTVYGLGVAWAVWTKRAWEVKASVETPEIEEANLALAQVLQEEL